MPIKWTERSSLDIQEIWTYVARDNPRAAVRQISLIEKATTNLKRFPNIGRPGRCAGTRELVIGKTPYVVAYQIKNNTIEILRVLHSRRRWPDSF
jgi:toxin ParE1/3/4